MPASLARVEEIAVRDLMTAFVACYNRGDLDGIAALYTADAVRIDGRGVRVEGREGIRSMYEAELARRAALPAGRRGPLRLEISLVLGLAEDRALVDGAITLGALQRRFTAVVERGERAWQLALGRVHPRLR